MTKREQIFNLSDQKLAEWVHQLLHPSRKVRSLHGVTFPILGPITPPNEYLAAVYADAIPEQQTQLRKTLVSLLRNFDKTQIDSQDSLFVWRIIDIASDNGWDESANKIRRWIADNAFANATVGLPAGQISLRSTLWSAITAWDPDPRLIPYLLRDFSNYEDHRILAICFREIGRYEPVRAIPLIPRLLLTTHEGAWQFLCSDLFESLGPNALLSQEFYQSWAEFASITSTDPYLASLLFDNNNNSRLVQLLSNAGIHFGSTELGIVMANKNDPKHSLSISWDTIMAPIEDHYLIQGAAISRAAFASQITSESLLLGQHLQTQYSRFLGLPSSNN